MACVYCRPSRQDGYLSERLTAQALRPVLEGLQQAGIRRVRFTGGEPLLSRHVLEAIATARDLGFEDIALTTNGTRLEALAVPLRAAGLERLTLSLDSLDPARFFRITRGGNLTQVLAGLTAALAAGFCELKLNCVVLRGENDDELESITRFAWERGIVPRFIELMPIAEGARLAPEKLVPAAEILQRLAPLLRAEVPEGEPDRGPARYVRSLHDAQRKIGVISGSSATYCEGCDRLRVSADGDLRPCLASPDAVSIRADAEAGRVASIADAVSEAWQAKPDGRTFRGCTEKSAADLSMRAIGG